jgi:hypothetical protein
MRWRRGSMQAFLGGNDERDHDQCVGVLRNDQSVDHDR